MTSTSLTNWERVDALTDGEIDTSDSPELTPRFFARARLRQPAPVAVTVSVAPAVRDWYDSLGEEEGQKRMASALRLYAEVHKSASPIK